MMKTAVTTKTAVMTKTAPMTAAANHDENGGDADDEDGGDADGENDGDAGDENDGDAGDEDGGEDDDDDDGDDNDDADDGQSDGGIPGRAQAVSGGASAARRQLRPADGSDHRLAGAQRQRQIHAAEAGGGSVPAQCGDRADRGPAAGPPHESHGRVLAGSGPPVPVDDRAGDAAVRRRVLR